MREEFKCPVCGRVVEKDLTEFTYDINGIPFRRVCNNCYFDIMNDGPGYDGRDYRNDHCEEIW